MKERAGKTTVVERVGTSVVRWTGGTLYYGPVHETSMTRKYSALAVLELGDTFKQAAKACHSLASEGVGHGIQNTSDC